MSTVSPVNSNHSFLQTTSAADVKSDHSQLLHLRDTVRELVERADLNTKKINQLRFRLDQVRLVKSLAIRKVRSFLYFK